MAVTDRPYSTTERLGVNAVERVVLRFNWIFREQHVADYGIDAEVEVCDDGVPTGRLLKLQIKSGASWFTERQADCIVFRDSARHFEYWLGHSVPVIVTLYDPATDRTWWQHITKHKAHRAGAGYKILIPQDHLLTQHSAPDLRAIVGRSLGERNAERNLTAISGEAILMTICSARRSIDIASPRVARPLIEALRRFDHPVRVRVVVDSTNRELVEELQHLKFVMFDLEVRLTTSLHLKQIVVDDNVAIYGSSISPDLSSANFEVVLQTTNEDLVRSMAHAFARIWSLAVAPDV